MGNDGGSIPTRTDLVKTKAKTEQAEKATQLLIRWFTCALSKRPLEQPIVSCPLGKLYNKDSVIQHLLTPSSTPLHERPFGTDGQLVASHIHSLKDLVTLKLTPKAGNGSAKAGAKKEGALQMEESRWMCPVSFRQMNGTARFVYVRECGCVLSEVAFKEMRSMSSGASKGNGKSNGSAAAEAEKNDAEDIFPCPVCSHAPAKGQSSVTSIPINPTMEEQEFLLLQLEEKRNKASAAKSSKKRKSTAATTTADDTSEHPEKRAKVSPPATSSQAVPTASLSSSILLELKAAREKPVSSVIASLYGKDREEGPRRTAGGANGKRSDWMTRGTFTRYA